MEVNVSRLFVDRVRLPFVSVYETLGDHSLRLRDHSLTLQDHPGLVQGWESEFLGGLWFLGNPKDSTN